MAMAENGDNGTLKTRIVMPRGVIGKLLFDCGGTAWSVESEKRRFFQPARVRLAHSGSLEESLKNLFMAECEKELKANFREETIQLAQKFAEELAPIFDQCIEEAERDFRKEFVQKLGIQGRSVIREIIQESFTTIGTIWSEEKKSTALNFASHGPFPPQTRFWWQLRDGESVYDMYLLEFPPDRRSIQINGMMRYVAFPWLCFVAAFKNGHLIWFNECHEASHCAFWYFYRPGPITSDKDSLYFSNLPHAWREWPYLCCLGSSLPVICLDNPNWSNALLSYFWQSGFSNADRWVSSLVRNKIEEIANSEKWEYLSKTDPDKMLTLPWPALGEDIGTFAKKTLMYLAQKKEKPNDKAEKAKERAISAFREKLEESLYFLGSSFVLRPETEKIVRKILGEKIGGLWKKMSKRLQVFAETVSENTVQNVQEVVDQTRQGDGHVPNLD